MNTHGYPPRLYWYIAAVLGVALPVAAGAAVGVALGSPDVTTGVGVILFFGLALLADMKPVPLDVENERVVSLAFVFVVSSQILFGWEYAVLTAVIGVLISQMVERRPFARSLFNAAVYGLAAFSSAIPVFLFGESSTLERITFYAFTGGALYVIVNVVLVCGALAILAGRPLRELLHDNLGHSGPAFLIMAFLAALAASLWTTDPWLLMLLAGPLFTLTLYQRSALSTKVATRDALTDSLTGLGNHRSYQACLREALERAGESGGEVSLCLVDVDEFKGCNDRYGHPLGDQILVELARLFVEGRDDVAAFRFGGDEFALLLEENEEDAYRFVEDLHDRIAQTEFPHRQPVTITVGIASYPGYASSADELQQVADGALYWAKRHGKNRSCVYSPSVVRIYSPNELAEIAERQARLRAAENLIRIVDSKDTYTERALTAGGETRRGGRARAPARRRDRRAAQARGPPPRPRQDRHPRHDPEEARLPRAGRAAARARPRPVRALAARRARRRARSTAGCCTITSTGTAPAIPTGSRARTSPSAPGSSSSPTPTTR